MFIAAHLGSRLWGGAEMATCELLRGLEERGHRTLLYCTSAEVEQGAAALGVPLRRLPLGGDAALHRALALALRLRRDRPDALIVATFRKLLLVSAAARLAGIRRVIARIGLETDVPRSAKYRFALARWVDAVVTTSGRVRPAFLALPGWSEERVTTILPAPRPLAPAAEPGALRRGLRLPEDAVVIGAV